MSKSIEELSYNDAMARIQLLTQEIEALDGDLDALVDKVKELKALILHCEARVMDAEMEIRDIFEEE